MVLTSQKINIMKLTKYIFIVAIFSLGLFASCTPESIEDGTETEQQIKRDGFEVPRQG